jgi:hypothetical protein
MPRLTELQRAHIKCFGKQAPEAPSPECGTGSEPDLISSSGSDDSSDSSDSDSDDEPPELTKIKPKHPDAQPSTSSASRTQVLRSPYAEPSTSSASRTQVLRSPDAQPSTSSVSGTQVLRSPDAQPSTSSDCRTPERRSSSNLSDSTTSSVSTSASVDEYGSPIKQGEWRIDAHCNYEEGRYDKELWNVEECKSTGGFNLHCKRTGAVWLVGQTNINKCLKILSSKAVASLLAGNTLSFINSRLSLEISFVTGNKQLPTTLRRQKLYLLSPLYFTSNQQGGFGSPVCHSRDAWRSGCTTGTSDGPEGLLARWEAIRLQIRGTSVLFRFLSGGLRRVVPQGETCQAGYLWEQLQVRTWQ